MLATDDAVQLAMPKSRNGEAVLQTINLENSQLEDCTVAQLCSALNFSPKLTVLNLSRNNCGLEAAKALGKMLSQQLGLKVTQQSHSSHTANTANTLE